MAQSALGCALAAGTAADRPQVVLHVDAAALRRYDLGSRREGGSVAADEEHAKMARQFVEWAEALAQQVDELDDELFEQPAGPTDGEQVRVLVSCIARLVQRLAQQQFHEHCAALELLLQAMRASGQRAALQDHSEALVRALGLWVDNSAHGDDCLAALAWLDTRAAVELAVTKVAEEFARHEIGGRERVIAALSRQTPHLELLFPALAEPLRRQRDRQLVWDRWHVKTAAAIAELAHELLAAGRLSRSPFADLSDELALLLAGPGARVATELTPKEQQAFQRLLDRP